MKRFGALMLAAILGSLMTIMATQWLSKENNQGVKIEHISGLPVSQVAYTKNDKGEIVPMDFTATAEMVTKAVVHISSTSKGASSSRRNQEIPEQFRQFFEPFEQRGPSQSSGSGVIINENGYIVTNNHVIDNADVVEVTLFDNRQVKAEVIGTDPDTDLAVIRINEKRLPHLSFVNSDQSKVGEWVLAVGNPFNLNSTVTAGIISAKGRDINIINRTNAEGGRTAIESFIQTDAAINPGNSGGALVNLQGGLLGINTAIASPTGAYSGYGFAVPANLVSKVVEDLIAFGTVQRGWLGIQVQNINSDFAKENDLDVVEGAYVAGYGDQPEKSAAKEAGIKEGDVVTKLDDTAIKSSSALIEYIGRKRPGDKIKVLVNHKGKEYNYTVTLKNKDGKVGNVAREEKEAVASLGLELEDLDPKVQKRLELESGVRVKSLTNGKIARYTDMEEGFIITHVNDKPVKSAKELNEILKNKKTGDQVIFAGVYEDYPREYLYAIKM
jgi:serine protease Do